MKIRLLLASVLMTFSVFGQNVPSYVPTNGLVGWWPFNGNANDESGNGNNGLVNGPVLTTDRLGNVTNAYQFSGLGDYIEFNNLNIDSISGGVNVVSFWCKWNGGNLEIPFSWDTSYTLYFSQGQFGFNTNQSNTIGVSSLGFLSQWKHIIAEFYNGVPDISNCKLWIDGISQNLNGVASLSVSATSKFILGAAFNLTTGNNYYFDGAIDDIGIWNRALTQQEITNLYNASTSIPIISCPGASMPLNLTNGLVGWWPFCGDADDESGNGNNGTVNGATLTSDRFGNGNSAYEFDGNSSSVNISDAVGLNNNYISLSAWFRTSSNSPGSIIYKTNASAINEQYACVLNYLTTNSGVNWSIKNGGNCSNPGTGWQTLLLNQSISDNNWHNLVCTYDGSISKIFVDAVLQLSDTFNTSVIDNCGGEINIGKGYNSTYFFNGQIDDIGIWNRALDSSEVAQLYNTGLCTQTIAGSCDTLIFNANITGFNPVTYANQVKVYPNPASDNLVIDCGTNYTGLNGYSIRITNLLGQTVYNSPVTAQITNIQLNSPTWVNGTYVVQFVHPNGTVVDTKRIIIQ